MMTVETTVTINIPEEGMTLEALEAEIAKSLQRAGCLLLKQACQAMEVESLKRHRSRLRRSKQRAFHLLTRFGWMKLTRWQMQDARGRFSCPLDAQLGLEPRQHASPWITEQAVSLATRLPYRQATYLLGAFVDEPIDHRSLYRWVQKAGAQIVAEEDELQTEVFKHGVIPPRDPQEREIILAEVDGTFLRAQREESTQFEVRLPSRTGVPPVLAARTVGVLITGKVLESRTIKHRRYRLLERVRYGGAEPAQDFGERLFTKGEAHLGLTRAKHLLLVGGGADWVEDLAGHNHWRATYQLDWWHLTHAFQRTFPDHPQLVHRLSNRLSIGVKTTGSTTSSASHSSAALETPSGPLRCLPMLKPTRRAFMGLGPYGLSFTIRPG